MEAWSEFKAEFIKLVPWNKSNENRDADGGLLKHLKRHLRHRLLQRCLVAFRVIVVNTKEIGPCEFHIKKKNLEAHGSASQQPPNSLTSGLVRSHLSRIRAPQVPRGSSIHWSPRQRVTDTPSSEPIAMGPAQLTNLPQLTKSGLGLPHVTLETSLTEIADYLPWGHNGGGPQSNKP